MKRTTIHPTLIDTPFKVGFECSLVNYRGVACDATVSGIDQVAGIVQVKFSNGDRTHMKYSDARRRWESCFQSHPRGRWLFTMSGTHIVW